MSLYSKILIGEISIVVPLSSGVSSDAAVGIVFFVLENESVSDNDKAISTFPQATSWPEIATNLC